MGTKNGKKVSQDNAEAQFNGYNRTEIIQQ